MTEASRTDPVAPGRIAVVIVNYRSAELTIACLGSLETERAAGDRFEVVVVDGNSGDGDRLQAAVVQHAWGDWVRIIVAERNGGFAYGNNVGITAARSANPDLVHVLLLNPDTEVRAGAVRSLAEFLDGHPDVGIAGSSFENPDGSDWPIAFRWPSIASEFERGARTGPITRLLRRRVVAIDMHGRCERVDWVSGASLMIRCAVLDAVGLMDEGYFLYYEELDLCHRAARAGWPSWYVPASRVMHIAGQSTGVTTDAGRTTPMPAYMFESRRRYFVKRRGVWYARAADLAFLAGRLLSRLRNLIQRRPRRDPPRFLRDFLRHSILWRSRRSALR